MLNLEEEVLHHPPRQFHIALCSVIGELARRRGQQPQHDEVAVPSIHLVEAPARHHVRIRQIQQSRRLDRQGLPQPLDLRRQPLHQHAALFPQRFDLRRLRKTLRQIQHRRRFHLRIPQRRAIQHRPPQRRPRIVDVSIDRRRRLRVPRRRRPAAFRRQHLLRPRRSPQKTQRRRDRQTQPPPSPHPAEPLSPRNHLHRLPIHNKPRPTSPPPPECNPAPRKPFQPFIDRILPGAGPDFSLR